MKQIEVVGYAHIYLHKYSGESTAGDEMDIEMYKKLIELDTKIGIRHSKQLFRILSRTTRHDVIKVLIGFAHIYLDKCFKQSKAGDEMDIKIFAKLVELDRKFGIKDSEQLYKILIRTTRLVIIKV